MSIIYIYDENMKKSRDAAQRNQEKLVKKFADFQKLKIWKMQINKESAKF